MAWSSRYTGMLKTVPIKVYADTARSPWAGAVLRSNADIESGIVTDVGVHTGSNVGHATIKFPGKRFGEHFQGHLPIVIKAGTGSSPKILFRGFLMTETAVISDSEDSVVMEAKDYKWFMDKCTKIRGRFYTVGNTTPSPYGSPMSQGDAKLKHEIFQGQLSLGSADDKGYLQNLPCVFNEGGIPNCAKDDSYAKSSVFRHRKMTVNDGGQQKIYKYDYNAFYWTYKSILAYIMQYWLCPYLGESSLTGNPTIGITSDSIDQVGRIDDPDNIPFDLSIDNMSPLAAIDLVVKSMPGKWTWWLEYTVAQVKIKIAEVNSTSITNLSKELFLAPTNEPVNVKLATYNGYPAYPLVKALNVTRDYSDAIKYVIIKGGKIRLTTTVELQPAYANTAVAVGGASINVPFKTVADFNKWKLYVLNKSKDTVFNKDHEAAYRYYCVPIEGSLLMDSMQAVTYNADPKFTDSRFTSLYGQIEVEFKKMFAQSVKIDRQFDAPCNSEFDKPVVFAFDEYLRYDSTNKYAGTLDRQLVVYDDKDYSFDNKSGLLIFDKPQYCRTSNTRKDVKDEDETQLPSQIDSIEEATLKAVADGGLGKKLALKSRRIFCTLSIDTDLAYAVGGKRVSSFVPVQSELPEYNELNDTDLIVHVNAFYPYKANSSVTISGAKGYTLAAAGDSGTAVEISDTMAQKILYPCDKIDGYNIFPNKNQEILFSKLSNLSQSKNWYVENIDVDFGCVESYYSLGDTIRSVINSDVMGDDGNSILNSGYYGLKDYVSSLSWVLNGARVGYSTKLTATNDINFTPSDFDKTMVDIVKRPSVFTGGYKSDSFIEIEVPK